MSRKILALPGAETFADALAPRLGASRGRLDWRHFPDGESLLAVDDAVRDEDVLLVACLRDPDRSALGLRFAAATLREFGARSVGLSRPTSPTCARTSASAPAKR